MRRLFLFALAALLYTVSVHAHTETLLPACAQFCELPIEAAAAGLFSKRLETYNVLRVVKNDIQYHVATYLYQLTVVTCLEGAHKGMQAILVHDEVKTASNKVEWHADHFVHFYPDGQVTSFPNKQIIEFTPSGL